MIPDRGLPWTEEALARLERAPAFVRALARQTIVAEARRQGEKVVTPEVVEHALGGIPPHPTLSPTGGEGKGEGAAAGERTMPWAPGAQGRRRPHPTPATRP